MFGQSRRTHDCPCCHCHYSACAEASQLCELTFAGTLLSRTQRSVLREGPTADGSTAGSQPGVALLSSLVERFTVSTFLTDVCVKRLPYRGSEVSILAPLLHTVSTCELQLQSTGGPSMFRKDESGRALPRSRPRFSSQCRSRFGSIAGEFEDHVLAMSSC